MLRGEADLALPQLDCSRRREGGGILGLQVGAYARLTLARLASQVRRGQKRETPVRRDGFILQLKTCLFKLVVRKLLSWFFASASSWKPRDTIRHTFLSSVDSLFDDTCF